MLAPLLTAHQVADVLGAHYVTVLGWARDGSLPAVRLGGRSVRFREDDVQAFIDARMAKTP